MTSSRSHSETKGQWPPAVVSCPLNLLTNPCHTEITQQSLVPGRPGQLFMKFVAENKTQKNDILGWIISFALSITFWICSFIPSSYKDLLSD